jgi:hypothetical protein
MHQPASIVGTGPIRLRVPIRFRFRQQSRQRGASGTDASSGIWHFSCQPRNAPGIRQTTHQTFGHAAARKTFRHGPHIRLPLFVGMAASQHVRRYGEDSFGVQPGGMRSLPGRPSTGWLMARIVNATACKSAFIQDLTGHRKCWQPRGR